MTKNDEILIENALEVIYFDWEIIDNMVEKANSLEAKETLRKIQSVLLAKNRYVSQITHDSLP